MTLALRDERIAEEDDDAEDEFDRCYELKLKVGQGKYQIDFRIPDLSEEGAYVIQVIASSFG
ncbi:MAG TPA: hypothetical protein VM680_10780 [Verrucomicrobiae bacterium]|nr:hypothetical protein [Verrucomicrobiae bacterium]